MWSALNQWKDFEFKIFYRQFRVLGKCIMCLDDTCGGESYTVMKLNDGNNNHNDDDSNRTQIASAGMCDVKISSCTVKNLKMVPKNSNQRGAKILLCKWRRSRWRLPRYSWRRITLSDVVRLALSNIFRSIPQNNDYRRQRSDLRHSCAEEGIHDLIALADNAWHEAFMIIHKWVSSWLFSYFFLSLSNCCNI